MQVLTVGEADSGCGNVSHVFTCVCVCLIHFFYV